MRPTKRARYTFSADHQDMITKGVEASAQARVFTLRVAHTCGLGRSPDTARLGAPRLDSAGNICILWKQDAPFPPPSPIQTGCGNRTLPFSPLPNPDRMREQDAPFLPPSPIQTRCGNRALPFFPCHRSKEAVRNSSCPPLTNPNRLWEEGNATSIIVALALSRPWVKYPE